MKEYKWIAKCTDGSFTDESKTSFKTKKECYNDMRNAVLEKMKWNTEYDEDFADLAHDEFLGYKVRFNQNEITHESYSGLYIYNIVEIEKMKTFEFTQEQIDEIIKALKDRQAMWEDHNKIIQMHGVDAQIEKFMKSNNEKITCIQTLINYLNA